MSDVRPIGVRLMPGLMPKVARFVNRVLNVFQPATLDIPKEEHGRGVRNWINAMGYQTAYPSTDPNRLFLENWFPRNATADQTLVWNLTNIIAQMRQLERSNSSVKSLVEGWNADCVASGIDVEPDTGSDQLNERIRPVWLNWCEDMTPQGHSLWEVQCMNMNEWCTGGASLLREVILHERVADGKLPITFQPLEVEWLCLMPCGIVGKDNNFSRGVESDKLGRPVAYHVMDYNLLNQMGLGNAFGGPGDVVPADQIIHGFEPRRPRQSHGEPLLAVVIERAYQLGKLVDIELKAAANTSVLSGVIKTRWMEDFESTRVVVDQWGNTISASPQQSPVNDMPIGTWARLQPGEEVELKANPRPNVGIAEFAKFIDGQMAASTRSSTYYLSKDPTGSNYSQGLRDEHVGKRMRAPIQGTFGKYNAGKVYEKVLPWILLSLGIEMPKDPNARRKMFGHKILPDMPEYLDPQKGSAASKFMIDSNLSTEEAELAARGKDWRKVRAQRIKETQARDVDAVARIKALKAELVKQGITDVTWAQIAALSGATTAPAAFLDAMEQPGDDDSGDGSTPPKKPAKKVAA